jgi:hypothetical protein
VARFALLLIIGLLFNCDTVNPEQTLKFAGHVRCGDCPDQTPIEGINVKIDLPRDNGIFESDSENVITDEFGNYSVTKRIKKDEFNIYYADVNEPYYTWCDNWVSPTGRFVLPTDITISKANIDTFYVCLTGKVELQANKAILESFDSLFIKRTYHTTEGEIVTPPIKISSNQTFTWTFYDKKVSAISLDFTIKKENGTTSESTIETFIQAKQTKQLSVSY